MRNRILYRSYVCYFPQQSSQSHFVTQRMLIKLLINIYLTFWIFYSITVTDISGERKTYKKCRAPWSKWMIKKTNFQLNITDINLNVTERQCGWINTSCTRSRQCPCETYYSKEFLGVQLPRKRNHFCVQTKSCNILICSSIVPSGSNIDSNKLVIKTYKVEERNSLKQNYTGIIYIPLDYTTWKLYEKDKIQNVTDNQNVKSEEFVYLDVIQTPISPVRANSYSLPLNTNDKFDNTTGYSIILLVFILVLFQCFIIFVYYFVKMCYKSSCTNIYKRFYTTKSNTLINEVQDSL
ncbi:hypothetical protein EWB00_004241 [Schistosoma japonicum]|uniref:Uncharacterized protein n=2 Tax=Schistosoma japonicum TaxID=6182 RepID=A0A4Z2D5I4_SCHJA|nr:hypothetical protein KSF78_0002545 [Schistosoma japonicum]TNN11708.1 hypothetical protein EWB00_004241 [Schistosoma japonicum]